MNGDAATANGAVCPHVALIKKRAAAYGSGGELTARRRTAFDPLPTFVSVNGDDGPCPTAAVPDSGRDRLSRVESSPRGQQVIGP